MCFYSHIGKNACTWLIGGEVTDVRCIIELLYDYLYILSYFGVIATTQMRMHWLEEMGWFQVT